MCIFLYISFTVYVISSYVCFPASPSLQYPSFSSFYLFSPFTCKSPLQLYIFPFRYSIPYLYSLFIMSILSLIYFSSLFFFILFFHLEISHLFKSVSSLLINIPVFLSLFFSLLSLLIYRHLKFRFSLFFIHVDNTSQFLSA